MVQPHVNQVTLIGRLAGEPSWKALPGGGEVVTWRMIIDRPVAGAGRRVVDTIPCASFDERVGGFADTWRAGDLIEVRGVLRRRFWTGPGGVRASRIEVHVHDADVLDVVPAGDDLPEL
ncbi:single-stranded DNA-binding protein [Actinomadura craniellae]|nr:single-stranded DNA-binding protein [Actinomadura craniellae]